MPASAELCPRISPTGASRALTTLKLSFTCPDVSTDANAALAPPHVRLDRFIDAAMKLSSGLTLDDIADAIGCSRASLTFWRRGTEVPASVKFRLAIQSWTGGKILVSEWGGAKERRFVRRVKPFAFADQIEV